jgi:hypothetical protein
VAYLKYYVKQLEGGLAIDSVACVTGEPESIPPDFVEWFNKDDWRYVPPINCCYGDGTLNLFAGHLERIR